MKVTLKRSAIGIALSAACIGGFYNTRDASALPILDEKGESLSSLFSGLPDAPGHPLKSKVSATLEKPLAAVADWFALGSVYAQGCGESDCQGQPYPWWETWTCAAADCAGGGSFYAYVGPYGQCSTCYPKEDNYQDCSGCFCHITSCQFC